MREASPGRVGLAGPSRESEADSQVSPGRGRAGMPEPGRGETRDAVSNLSSRGGQR